jgi:hypothetical protein
LKTVIQTPEEFKEFLKRNFQKQCHLLSTFLKISFKEIPNNTNQKIENMETLSYETIIDAPKQKVWDILWTLKHIVNGLNILVPDLS